MSIKKLTQDMGRGRLEKNRGYGLKRCGVMPGLIIGVVSTEKAVFARTTAVHFC
jgi:hypothetical protein